MVDFRFVLMIANQSKYKKKTLRRPFLPKLFHHQIEKLSVFSVLIFPMSKFPIIFFRLIFPSILFPCQPWEAIVPKFNSMRVILHIRRREAKHPGRGAERFLGSQILI